MNFLRNLFRGTPQPTTSANLRQHDAKIAELEASLDDLRRAEPLTARVRGIYPARRVRVVRISPRNRGHHAQG